jgi:sugar phosphate isomerase/epimerase
LAHVHAKNSAWRQTGRRADGSLAWQAEWAPLDEGIVDLGDLLSALRAVGYDGWISVEDFTTEPPLSERVRNNLRSLRRAAGRTED